MSKKLYKSKTNRLFSGVAGGLAEYFSIDPIFVRGLFVVMAFVNGMGFMIYFVMMLLVPDEDVVKQNEGVIDISSGKKFNWFKGDDGRRNLLALIIILIGLGMLASKIWPNILSGFDFFWPLAIIVFGIFLLAQRAK